MYFSLHRPMRHLCLVLLVAGGWGSNAAWAQPPQPGDYSPERYEVIEERNQKAPMRDGVELTVDIFRPKADGKFPAILAQTPYDKNGLAGRAHKFAKHGFVVINADSRGRYQSGGEWDPFSPLHKTDGYDLVEWIAKQPWCNGNVGMYGSSYLGWQQWWTATQTPPSLKAIVPEVAPPDQFYNVPYQNGILMGCLLDWAGLMSGREFYVVGPWPYGGFTADRLEAYSKLPYIDFDKTRNYLPTTWWRKWMEQNTASDEYWRGIAYQSPTEFAKVHVPSLGVSGWFDADFSGTPMNYLGVKQHGGTPLARRPRMVVGPWEHAFNAPVAELDFGQQAYIDWDGYVMRWFDHHLSGIDNGVMDDPPVHVFVMGRNQWRAEQDWPLPGTQFTKYYLHSDGKANSSQGDGQLSMQPPAKEPADHYTYNPLDPTPSPASGNGHIDGPRNVSGAAARNDVLVYDTPELTEDVEVVGPITANLFAATSAPDTDWMVRLVDVYPDGRALFLAEGVMRARYRDPERHGAFNPYALSKLVPGETYEYTIEFWRPTGNLFVKGHRIRVEISSSYFPYYLRNPNLAEDNIALAKEFRTAEQTIFHDEQRPSHVVLPIIPANR